MLLTALALTFLPGLNGQSLPSNDAEFEKEYAKRIQKDELYGVYIPVDLEDCFRELNRLASSSGLTQFKAAPEDSIRTRLHFGLGKWIGHNWGFYGGSRLSHHLKELGLTHPDDMIQLIIVCYHRFLHDKDLDVEVEIQAFQKKRQEEYNQREQRKKVIHEETRIRKH